MGKKIAFIGSSGGNLYKQGGNNLSAMMKEICGQTTAADMEITFVQYVLASGSLDNVCLLYTSQDGKREKNKSEKEN